MNDPADLVVLERFTLEKFDGDSQDPADLLERITVEADGTITEHWIKDED